MGFHFLFWIHFFFFGPKRIGCCWNLSLSSSSLPYRIVSQSVSHVVFDDINSGNSINNKKNSLEGERERERKRKGVIVKTRNITMKLFLFGFLILAICVCVCAVAKKI